MRTLIIILGGLLLLAAGLLVDRLMGGHHVVRIAQVFIGIWFVIALLNMWAGVARAGYSVAEEFPIFLVILLVPAGVAALIAWKFA